ncbi:MAG TPA: MFS transporter [Jatrophihabitans sp.]|jgi:MFS family permease|uniref:MFS transporter n=1 Tax=Jatrophihabitans sp. TaxID=1932789 RepID=UPI002F0D2894
MSTKTSEQAGTAGIWATFNESPVAVKAIFGGVFVNRVGGFLNIFLVLYLIAEGYSASQAALGLGAYGIGGVLGVLIGGMLADRLGARNATVLSMSSSAVLIASLLYLHDYLVLLIAVGLVGLVSQIFRPASATLLSELTPESRQVMIFAMYRFGLNVGTTVAPLLGFALYHLDDESFTLLFWGEALIALIYAGLAMATLPRRTIRAAGADASEPTGGYTDVLRDRRYVLYLFATLINAAVYTQYLSTLPLDVQAEGVPIFWYTFAVALNGVMVIAFELPLTKLSQKWPLKLTIGLAFTLVGVGVACYGLPLGPAVIIIGTLIWTTAEVIGAPTVFAYPAMAGPAHLRGRYIGSFQFMFAMGSAIGPMIGGALFTQLGHQVWWVLGLGGLVAAPLGMAAIRTPVKPAADPPPASEQLASAQQASGQQASSQQAPGQRPSGQPSAELPPGGVSVAEQPPA